jgi:hypothetical protein
MSLVSMGMSSFAAATEEISGYPASEVIGDSRIWEILYPDPSYREESSPRQWRSSHGAVRDTGVIPEPIHRMLRVSRGRYAALAKEAQVPVNIKVIHTSDFIRTTVDGALDLPTSRQILLDIASMIRTPGEFQILIDTRQAEVKFSTVDLFELGVAVANHPAVARSKTALLTSIGGAETARLLELVARNRGVLLKAFTSFEEAITWLVMKEQGG